MPFDPTFLWFPGAGVVALGIVILSRLLSRTRPDGFVRRVGVPLGLAAGYAAGEFGVFGTPGFPPLELAHWVVALVLGAGVLGVIQVVRPGAKDFRWGVRALMGGLALMFMLRFRTTQAEIGIVAAVGLFLWWNLESLSRNRPARIVLTAMGLVSAGLAVCLKESGSIVLAERAGLLAFALLGTFAAIGRGPSEGLAFGGVGVFLAGYLTPILGGIYDSELTLAPVLALTAGLLVPRLASLPKVRDLRPWLLAGVQVILILACVGGAIGLTLAGRPAAPADDEAALYKAL